MSREKIEVRINEVDANGIDIPGTVKRFFGPLDEAEKDAVAYMEVFQRNYRVSFRKIIQ